ncbi:MAG: MFS transporter [Gemmatimonadota bacterium]|jgi:dienelactone hydrolase
MRRTGFHDFGTLRRGLPALLMAALALPGCRGSLQLTPSDYETVLAHQALDAPDPAAPGRYGVRRLYYGSGTDLRRPEYRDSVRLVTEAVDGSKLVDLGSSADERNEYWGFTPEAMPLNGRVWYPDAPATEGPFPLVLVVHGNHDMKDFSDPGYDYLGELLASRGFILASVDMNFINGGIRGENDGRGWLLLKHLQAWERFAAEEDSPFHGLVDMEHIALMGHSRGGEAVAVAAAFNRLERYPDDASLEFDFGFPIRGVVAIAPVDGQYLPTSRSTPLRDVSYLVFHGSHDGDVTSFHGLRQYERLELTPGSGHFKAAVYMYRANHGQWNTVWGAHDNGPRSGRILDLRYLIAPEKQRRLAETYVTAFLESRLHGDDRWLPLFRDYRVAGGWLPETMYVTRFQDDSFRPLATYEEDIDVTRGTPDGVRIQGDSLETWKEDQLLLRSSNRPTTSSSQDNQAVWLAWNNRIAGADTTRHGPPASYTVTLPAGLADEWRLDRDASLHLDLAPTERVPPPRKDPAGQGEGGEGRGEGRPPAGSGGRDGGDEDAGKPPVDLTVELEDGQGRVARLPLSRYGAIRRPLEIHISRRPDRERERFAHLWEMVLQTYTIPLSDFTSVEPALDPSSLRAVRLVFDRVHAGEVVVDDIGFSHLEPAFWSARLPAVAAKPPTAAPRSRAGGGLPVSASRR